jgi:predicted GNAT family N-acyltransferase
LLECRLTLDDAEVRDAQDLRVEVFCREQGVPHGAEIDGLDRDALHVVAVDRGEIVATCRLLYEGEALRLARMAVREGRRGEGIGSALLEEAEAEAKRRGAREVVLHAQRSAEPFYAAHGYETEGTPFVEVGIEHLRMRKSVWDPLDGQL